MGIHQGHLICQTLRVGSCQTLRVASCQTLFLRVGSCQTVTGSCHTLSNNFQSRGWKLLDTLNSEGNVSDNFKFEGRKLSDSKWKLSDTV